MSKILAVATSHEVERLWRPVPAARRRVADAKARADEAVTRLRELEEGLARMESAYYAAKHEAGL